MESVHQLKVTLLEIEPVVWRRIHVPSDTTLYGLHAVIQVAMGWDDSHLWQFGAGGHTYGHWQLGGNTGASAWETTVGQVLPHAGNRAGYVYDMGDHWQHTIEVEKVHAAARGIRYPRCTGGRRACPPEDCGGPEGYYDTLKVLRSRKGWRYRELRENGLGKYNPAAFDLAEVNDQLSDDPKLCRYTLPAPWHPAPDDQGSAAAETGQGIDQPVDPLPVTDRAEQEPVNVLTTPVPDVEEAAQAVRDAAACLEGARAVLGRALRAERDRTGESANVLAARVAGAMSRPLVLQALRQDD